MIQRDSIVSGRFLGQSLGRPFINFGESTTKRHLRYKGHATSTCLHKKNNDISFGYSLICQRKVKTLGPSIE